MRALLHLLIVAAFALVGAAVGVAVGAGGVVGLFFVLPQGDYGPRTPEWLLIPAALGVVVCCAGVSFGGRFAYRRVEVWLPLK